MLLTTFLHDVTDHLRVYLLAGTLFAVGIDVAGNVSSAIDGGLGDSGAAGAMTGMGMTGMGMTGMGMTSMAGQTDLPVILAVQAVGALIALVGGALYLANMWAGFLSLRQFRFRFKERGPLLKACGWSAAFAYVLTSTAIGLAINAVYLVLVG